MTRIRPHRETGDHDALLIDALRSMFRPEDGPSAARRLAELTDQQQSALLARALRQEIGPLVALRLLSSGGLSEDARAAARRMHCDNLARNLYIRAETDRWVGLFAEGGIPSWPLKGAGASILLYEDLGARTCADIDLLVRTEDFRAALRIASAQGFEPAGQAAALRDPDLKVIDLQPRDPAVAYSLDLHSFIERPLLAPIDHRDFWRSPEGAGAGAGRSLPLDLTGVVLCLHLWRHGFTLKTLVDFAAFVHRFDDQVPAVRRRLEACGARDGLDLALLMAHRVLGVRSGTLPEIRAKTIMLPLLERCLRTPFVDRGRYFGWLVVPLQFDGFARPFARVGAHLLRPPVSDGRLHLVSRLARLGRTITDAALPHRRVAGRPKRNHETGTLDHLR